MKQLPDALEHAKQQFESLPGVGPKTAERFVLYLMKRPQNEVEQFSQSLMVLKKYIHICPQCFHFADRGGELCSICRDVRRDRSAICVVAESSDLIALERSGEFNGLYHVLGGNLSPIHGFTPDRLHIQELVQRIEEQKPHEIMLALNPDVDGESTSLYLARIIKQFPVRLTQLARGLPMGSDLDYADEITLTNAINNRREII